MWVTGLHERHPGVTLQMCEMWQSESVNAVRSGRLEIGLARCPGVVDGVEYPLLHATPLGVVLGDEHPLARQDQVDLHDLVRLTLAIWPRSLSPGFYDLLCSVRPGSCGRPSPRSTATRAPLRDTGSDEPPGVVVIRPWEDGGAERDTG